MSDSAAKLRRRRAIARGLAAALVAAAVCLSWLFWLPNVPPGSTAAGDAQPVEEPSERGASSSDDSPGRPGESTDGRALARGPGLRVRVVDGARVPVAGVRLRVARSASGEVPLDAQTDDLGTAFIGCGPGEYRLLAIHEAYLPAVGSASVVEAGDAAFLELMVQSGHYVEGRVVMRDGSAVEAAKVVVEPMGGSDDGAPRTGGVRCEVLSDGEGRFVVGPLDEFGYRLDVLAPGRVVREPTKLRLLRATNEVVVVDMDYLVGSKWRPIDRASGREVLWPATAAVALRVVPGVLSLSSESSMLLSPRSVGREEWAALQSSRVLAWRVTSLARIEESFEGRVVSSVAGRECMLELVRFDRLASRDPTSIECSPPVGQRAFRLRIVHSDDRPVTVPHFLRLVRAGDEAVASWGAVVTREADCVYLQPGRYRAEAGTDGFVAKPCGDVMVDEAQGELVVRVPPGGDIEFTAEDAFGEQRGFRLKELRGLSGPASNLMVRDMDFAADMPSVLRSYPPGRYSVVLVRLGSPGSWRGNVDVAAHETVRVHARF
jgi:hypothetical protein